MLTKKLFPIVLAFILFSCTSQENVNLIKVQNKTELENTIKEAQPGDEIVLANGTWEDVQIELTCSGTEGSPITFRAETAGEVYIEGQSYLKFGGDYLVVSGLFFRNGYTPSRNVIEYKLGDKVASNCTLTECVIENFNQLNRNHRDSWIALWGRHNELSNCHIVGKSNTGPTIVVEIKGRESIKNFHKIINNHFGPRPRLGGPSGETIRIGDSSTSMSPSNTLIANNLFDRCNGEVEVVSSKTNFNEFRNNVFYKCEGSMVMRHGNYCMIDGNYFIGDDNSDNMGGIRIVNTGHWVVNNYFYNIKGNNFRSALAVMNGIPKSPLNRYNQVTDVVVAHNTWVNCKSPLQFSVGTNVSQRDVLPPSEIRSARPIRSVVANNIIYNEQGDDTPIFGYEKITGVKFKSNIINNQGIPFEEYKGLEVGAIEMNEIADDIFVPANNLADFEVYEGFDFETITEDIFGNSRIDNNSIGAVNKIPTDAPDILDEEKYGANWYSNRKSDEKGSVLTATIENLTSKIAEAKSGDVVELEAGEYQISASLVIDKNITIQSKSKENKAQISYSGESKTPAIEMHPEGDLLLKNIILKGSEEQYAFACLQKNMSSLYNVKVDGCEISNFYYVLKAYKESFSDEIVFTNSTIKNCENGIELSEETNDRGGYNAEFITIDNCNFDGVRANVIDYYRGGYDESTIGGNLKISNSTFTNCGANEASKILLNHRGIINVDISENTFKNNRVKLVALLWGAKNNTHSDNDIVNSGKIVVEENIKLTLMY